MSLGSRIHDQRKNRKMSQEKLAEMIGVSFQAVSNWENDKYLPETDKLKKLAEALGTTVAFLMEEQEPVADWELHDAMFSVENMLKKVKSFAQAKKMTETLKALNIMCKYHEGTFRKSKSGERIPYIIHPLTMACHAFALGVDSDDLVAAILLHDVVEDCPVSLEELEVNDKIKEAVNLVSFRLIDGLTKEESKKIYYENIMKNPIASMVKIIDRCNNVSTMATGFSKEKMAQYIEETECYVIPVLNNVKHEYHDYYNAAFLIKYQIYSVMESLKRTM